MKADRYAFVPSHVHFVVDDLQNVVVMNSRTGKLFGLYNTAAAIWMVMAKSGSEAAAVQHVAQRYAVDVARAKTGVNRLLDQLLAADLMAVRGTE